MSENQRLTISSYQPARARSTTQLGLAAFLVLAGAVPSRAQLPLAPDARCTPDLTDRFAPIDPDARNTYVVCLAPLPLDDVRPPHWRIERLIAAEAFAGVAPEVRRALAQLYGGARLRVARGLLEADGFNAAHDGRTFDAYTLIEPAPSASLDATVPGTLIIRTRIVRPAREPARP